MTPSSCTPEEFIKWRKSHGWSRAFAAMRLGLSKFSVDNYERGERPDMDDPVRIPRVVALAAAAITAGLDPLGGD